MYHPGKVIEIFSYRGREIESAEATTQAAVEMWDDNVLTFLVHPKLAGKLKEGDIVLVDYSPSGASKAVPVPRNLIVKILRGKSGARAWERYKEFHKNQRVAAMSAVPAGIVPQQPAMYR